MIHAGPNLDLPAVTQITDDLWVGGVKASKTLYPELPREFLFVVALTKLRYRNREGTATIRSPIGDGDHVDGALVDDLAGWVNVFRAQGPTLVHCESGLNRAPLVVARALILEGMSPDEAISLLREKRSPRVLNNPAFENWLRDV